MKEMKRLGIWMDHSRAYIMELKGNLIVPYYIVSETMLQESEKNLPNGRIYVDFDDTFKQEKQEKSNYYGKISDIIRNFKEVVIFGPTNAKSELINLMQADHLFAGIKIEKLNTDKMTENEMHALVKEHYQQ